MGSCVDLWRVLQVGVYDKFDRAPAKELCRPCSELAEPHKLLSYLLQPRILSLSPDVIAVYLHAAMKVFGSWTAELADRWDDDDLPRVRVVVDDAVERFSSFVTHADIDVQERVRASSALSHLRNSCAFLPRYLSVQAAELLQLFTFVRADLSAYQPLPRSSLPYSESGMVLSAEGFGEPSSTVSPSLISEPHFPKGMYLIKPLFGAYELNAVALSAQASVPVPDGLDLDAWIVPFQDGPSLVAGDAADEALEGKKGKKGKRKEGASKSKRKGKSRAQDDTEDGGDRSIDVNEYGVAAQPIETEEERAERERVSVELVLVLVILFAALFATVVAARHPCLLLPHFMPGYARLCHVAITQKNEQTPIRCKSGFRPVRCTFGSHYVVSTSAPSRQLWLCHIVRT